MQTVLVTTEYSNNSGLYGRQRPIKLPAQRDKQIMNSSNSIEIFFCYSHQDESLRDELEKHLRLLQRQGLISAWHDRRIGAGEEWEGKISESMDRARIILLLVSVDFINSDYCWNIEMEHAMTKHAAGTARVIPVILRSCDWHEAPFGKLQALPTDARPVTDPKWQSYDNAFLDITKGIKKVVNEVRSTSL